MKSAKRIFAVVVILICGALGEHGAHAQNALGGLHFLVGIPMGDFKSNVDKNGYGLSASIGFAPVSSFFAVGLEAGFMRYGTERRRERFSSTIPDVMVDVETSNNFALVHGVLRLQPNQGAVRPYLEGIGGINYLYTQTEIQNRGRGGEEVASSNNKSDVAFSYGGGGGMMIRLYESDDEEGAGIAEVLLDLRARYIKGGEAEYLKQGSIRRENGEVKYDVLKSHTDIMTLQLGVALRF
jgi:hypothetical protein